MLLDGTVASCCWMAAEASGMLLGEAASKGDVAVVERWLEQGVKPEDESHFFNPYEFGGELAAPLWCAAFCGHTAVIALLQNVGADPEWADSNGWTAMHVAATFGDKHTAERLAKGGVKVDPYGSPLPGSDGAKIDVRDVDGTTPLMYVAAEGGDRTCAETLLRLGANPALRASGGRFAGKTAEQIAVEMGKAAVAALLSNRAVETEAEEDDAGAALAATASAKPPPAVTTDNPSMGVAAFRGDLPAVASWLKYGIEPEDEGHFRVDPGGYWGSCSPLWWAAAEGHTEVVAALQQAGANPEWANENGWTTLHISARLGQEETAEQLVQGGAEVDAVTRSGATALMWAAAFDKPACIEVLLELGANPALEDKAGRTALRIAAYRGHTESCERLVEGRAKLDATNKHGMTALMLAAYWDHPACVKALLSLGADPALTATSGGCVGATALQIADRQGKQEIMALLEDSA